MHDRIRTTRQRPGLALALCLLLMTAAAAFAQTAAPVDPNAVPARVGNVYDHRDHQPTAADDAAAGIAPPYALKAGDVQREIDELLRQTDELDKRSEQRERGRD